MDRITEHDIEVWERDGYVVVAPFLDDDELHVARAALHGHFPDWDMYAARTHEYQQRFTNGLLVVEFPYHEPVLNQTTMHPELVAAVRRLLGTEDIRLTQSLAVAKYAGAFDHEQELHTDFDNNSLVVPHEDGMFRQIPAIFYLTDVTLELGPTYYVKRQFSAGLPLSPRHKSRVDHPDLYRHEQPLCVPAGSLLLHSMSGFHRGSRLHAKAGLRLTLHVVYRSAACEWQGWSAWPRISQQPLMHQFLTLAAPEERTLLGFPPPGHDYWTEATLTGVALRYPGIDLTSYRTALHQGGRLSARNVAGYPTGEPSDDRLR
jgi:Phytanoyl-CoA dioxygenase (PhyH)